MSAPGTYREATTPSAPSNEAMRDGMRPGGWERSASMTHTRSHRHTSRPRAIAPPMLLGPSGVTTRISSPMARPHVRYSAADPLVWVCWATTDLVIWRIGEKAFVGKARPVDDPGRLQIDILPEFTRHFGPERVSRWFGPQVGCVALSESANGP